MEKLTNKLDDLLKVLQAFERCINQYFDSLKKATEKHHEEISIIALIKLFELTSECLWKALKALLRSEGATSGSSKDVIRQSYEFSFITKEESLLLLEAIDDRNSTSHGYYNDEIYRKKLCDKILNKYYPMFKEIAEKIDVLNKKLNPN